MGTLVIWNRYIGRLEYAQKMKKLVLKRDMMEVTLPKSLESSWPQCILAVLTLHSLKVLFPSVESMNCEELCNCLSCGHGNCSDEEDQDKCPGNESGFICRCSNSPSYPHFNTILRDMLSTGNACRQCDN